MSWTKWKHSCISLKFSLQVKYCSEECRQRAWDHYHRTLCLGQNEGDPSHPLEQLQESWRFFIIFFSIFLYLFLTELSNQFIFHLNCNHSMIFSFSNCLTWVWFSIRKMHYPPETASVMLIAQMIATVLQVSIAMKWNR